MLDWQALQARANDDGEFRIQARFWNAIVRFTCGQESTRIDMRDGKIAAIEPWFGNMAGNLTVTASEDDWDALLAPIPKPFYQDLFAATVHHGFETAGDTKHYCAYYPAIRRLIELMREVKHA